MIGTDAGERFKASMLLLESGAKHLNVSTADVESTTVDEAAYALKWLRDVSAVVRQCEAGLERWIATCFREEGWRDPHELVGIGVVEVRRSKDRRAWQHDRVRSDWLNAYMAQRGGEAPDPSEVRDAFLEVAAVSGYKVTGLRALDLDPDDYCESSPSTPRVVIA